MGRMGTDNAAILWRVAKTNESPMTEAELRDAAGLGTGTVNRIVKLLVSHGFMKTGQRLAAGMKAITVYEAVGCIEDVRAKLGRGPTLDLPANASRPFSYYGQDIGRVSSIFQLGQV